MAPPLPKARCPPKALRVKAAAVLLCASSFAWNVVAGDDVDVVVVGAGYAGLVAARRLKQHGISVAVVEALERAGGGFDRLTLAR